MYYFKHLIALVVFLGAIVQPTRGTAADATQEAWPQLPFNEYPLQDALRLKHRIEVPIMPWPSPPKRLLRVSAQLYNSLPQYELLAKALIQELPGA